MPVYPSRILVCGGRNFKDINYVYNTLDSAKQYFDDEFVIITGGASGVDAYAFVWAQNQGFPTLVMDAPWRFYSKSAGAIRNAWMLKWATPDLVIAFPGGRGTTDMMTKAKEAGVQLYAV